MLLVYLPDLGLPAHCRVQDAQESGQPPQRSWQGTPRALHPSSGREAISASSWAILGQSLWVLSLNQQRGCTAPLPRGLQEKAEQPV